MIENKITYTRFQSQQSCCFYQIKQSDEEYPTIKIFPKDNDSDITIVCYGGMLEVVESCLNNLFENHELLVEIICPSQLYPLNTKPISDSVEKTRKVLIVEEGKTFASWGSEVVAHLSCQNKWAYRCHRIGNDAVIPSNLGAELETLVGPDQIIEAVLSLID